MIIQKNTRTSTLKTFADVAHTFRTDSILWFVDLEIHCLSTWCSLYFAKCHRSYRWSVRHSNVTTHAVAVLGWFLAPSEPSIPNISVVCISAHSEIFLNWSAAVRCSQCQPQLVEGDQISFKIWPGFNQLKLQHRLCSLSLFLSFSPLVHRKKRAHHSFTITQRRDGRCNRTRRLFSGMYPFLASLARTTTAG